MEIRGIDLFTFTDYRNYLRTIFNKRKTDRKKYTYSIWAKELGISSVSGLTMVIKGQRHPGKSLLEKIIKNLELTDKQETYFRKLVDASRSAKGNEQTLRAIVEINNNESKITERQVEFRWEMGLLREMFKWNNFSGPKEFDEIKYIFPSLTSYKDVFKEMQESKLISVEDGRAQINKAYTPQYKIDPSQFKDLNDEVLENASNSYFLEKDSRSLEHHFVNIKNKDKLAAKKKLESFLKEFIAEFEATDVSSEESNIYLLSGLLIPYTK